MFFTLNLIWNRCVKRVHSRRKCSNNVESLPLNHLQIWMKLPKYLQAFSLDRSHFRAASPHVKICKSRELWLLVAVPGYSIFSHLLDENVRPKTRSPSRVPADGDISKEFSSSRCSISANHRRLSSSTERTLVLPRVLRSRAWNPQSKDATRSNYVSVLRACTFTLCGVILASCPHHNDFLPALLPLPIPVQIEVNSRTMNTENHRFLASYGENSDVNWQVFTLIQNILLVVDPFRVAGWSRRSLQSYSTRMLVDNSKPQTLTGCK